MCGIAGLWVKAGALSADRLAATARAMGDALRARGPDGGGQWSDREAGVALAHRRLSVIDLSEAGAQPMVSACGRYVLVYNGEIYNHADLRAMLVRAGATGWRGHSDTETLLALIVRDGLDAALRQCIGAFALALWDRRDRVLSLARDRMGEKPLYYGWSAGRLVFGSELKALRAVPGFDNPVDPAALALFLRGNAVPAPWSIFQHVRKLRPGHIVSLAMEGAGPGEARERVWYALAEVIARPTLQGEGDADAIARIEGLLGDAVARQMVADVPVGAFLSGGIDSSLVTALMCAASPARAVKTFSIGFAQGGFDEAPFARAVARHLGTDHHELYVDAGDIQACIPELPRIWDEPFADSSQVPTLLVSRMARQTVTVALSGDAGDELFCGYNRYLVPRGRWDALRRLPLPLRRMMAAGIAAPPPHLWDRLGGARVPMLGAKLGKVGRMLGGDLSTRAIYRASSQEWGGALPLAAGALPGLPGLPDTDDDPIRATPEEQMMQWDMGGYLTDDILVKVDRASMSSGLEVRVPLLDHRVIEAAWALPLSLKVRQGQGKWLLRQILARHVPTALFERPKAGFAMPVGAWLRGDLRDWAEDLLSPAALTGQPMFDAAPIRRRWQQHTAGTHDWTGSLWGILMYQAWARAQGVAAC